MNIKLFKISVALVAAILLYFIYILYFPNITPKSGTKAYICVPENSTVKDVENILNKEVNITNTLSFQEAVSLLKYRVRSGRYEITKGMSNKKLIRMLKEGKQAPVRLTFNNIRTKEQLAERLSKQLEIDSTSIINLLNNTVFLSKYHLNPNTSVVIFIPNTYQVLWNITAKGLFYRMKWEYDRFWTPKRKAEADSIPLTPIQVSTLASIVEEETNSKMERPIIAGLYINRLKRGMPLQADPTIKFALGNFSIKRILREEIQKPSPYNTYLNTGLPPGPIRVPSPQGIDAVLHYTKHHYLYMCAKETLDGKHNFSRTFKEHEANAMKYRKALNKMRIFK